MDWNNKEFEKAYTIFAISHCIFNSYVVSTLSTQHMQMFMSVNIQNTLFEIVDYLLSNIHGCKYFIEHGLKC